jgi:hypothetical protein
LCDVYFTAVKCKEGYDDVLTHAAKTHLRITIMDSEQDVYDIVSALELM